jgi:hypothetical protein
VEEVGRGRRWGGGRATTAATPDRSGPHSSMLRGCHRPAPFEDGQPTTAQPPSARRPPAPHSKTSPPHQDTPALFNAPSSRLTNATRLPFGDLESESSTTGGLGVPLPGGCSGERRLGASPRGGLLLAKWSRRCLSRCGKFIGVEVTLV